MKTHRSEARRQFRNSAGTHEPSRNKKAADHDVFLRQLLSCTGARAALERLGAAGMRQEVIIAHLRLIALSPSEYLSCELPDAEDLRRAAVRIQKIGEEIARLNRNEYMNPDWALNPWPRSKQTYAHMFALIPGALRAYSGYLLLQAWRMGEIGKGKLTTSKLFAIKMLEHTKEITGREHYNEIACLLTATAAAGGSKEVTEPNALKMLLSRYRTNMTRGRSWASLPKSLRELIHVDGLEIRKRPSLGERIAGLTQTCTETTAASPPRSVTLLSKRNLQIRSSLLRLIITE